MIPVTNHPEIAIYLLTTSVPGPSTSPYAPFPPTLRLTDCQFTTLLSLFSPPAGSHPNAGDAFVASLAICSLLQLCGSLETAEI